MTTKSKIKLAARIVGTAAVAAAALGVLGAFGYLQQLTQIDNLIGALPVSFSIMFAVAAISLIWIKHTRSTAPVSIALAAVIALSAALFPNSLYGNWWINYYTIDSSGSSPDLSVYAPFEEDSLAAVLDEPCTLRLDGELPVLDGATALYPVYAAFAQAVYDPEDYTPDHVRCTNSIKAYSSIISGDADVIFVAAPSEGQLEEAQKAGVELCFTPIALEAFVFITGKSNPVESLTVQQIRNIYSGKTARWSTLGWDEGGRIVAFRRPEGSGSESGLYNLVMKDSPVFVPQPLPDLSLVGTNSLMQQISVEWNGVQPALGYSYRYFVTQMYPNPDAKLLTIDGYAPTNENIRTKKYPYVAEVYAVTNGSPQGDVKKLIEWILSPQGQLLIEKTGYTPID